MAEKNISHILVGLVLFSFSISSCQKCVRCAIVSNAGLEITHGEEVCGHADVKAEREKWDKIYESYSIAGSDYSLNCENQ